MRPALPLTFALAAALGCQSNSGKAPVVAAPVQPTAGPASAPATEGLRGKVLERLDAAPYSYLRLQTAKGEVWTAVPETKVEKGTEVTLLSPMLMSNFESKTLKRTFPEVYFGTLAPEGAPAPSGPAVGNPHAQASATPMETIKVDKAPGAEARTVAEIWAQKGSLKEKRITLRGKVVKYNAGIMGRNWLHLQDGSGDPKAGTHDLAVTTQDVAARGDIVTVKGVVRLDKDFGSGYTYAVILEDAKVEKK